MSGGNQSVKIVLRNPVSKTDTIDYTIQTNGSQISNDWIVSLKDILRNKLFLEKNYCFVGFPNTARNLTYLCNELNAAVYKINMFNYTRVWQDNGLETYPIEDYYTPDVIRYGDEYPIKQDGPIEKHQPGLVLKHGVMNRLHNHFEILQGTVTNLSPYYKLADYETKYAIRQLNNICHEIESLVLSQRKQITDPVWVRPSQITTFLHAPRLQLTDEHRKSFNNTYDRVFGGVYMHWAQIGKTLFEVFRDEGAPTLTQTVCEAITHLEYYSGEFDVEWGNDVTYKKSFWHTKLIDDFKTWLVENNLEFNNPELSLGYLPLGQIALKESFGTTDETKIRLILGNYLDIYKIEAGDISCTFDYCWADLDYKQKQINMMMPGYDYSSRR